MNMDTTPSAITSAFEYAPAPESRSVVDIAPSYGLFIDGEFTEAAGGIRTSKDAIKFLVVVNETAGEDWLDNHWFRFGASSLLNDLLMQRQKLATGRYSGLDYVTVD